MSRVYVGKNWFPKVLNRLAHLHEVRVWEGEDTPPRDVFLREV